ncbi:HAD-IIIC family phosphatase [Methylobacterium sp. J-026]|uniref:HAD-IIIC family phosphatase n=1 Tax=Methylobacterium sp. J-026 TaxID=2836624 RepID=UPI001FB9CC96|nr:HAD-IIIC family phosphatase [Methylobacterium sp. J-026]MCJ2132484.1 HAD-IIIC family phosphatase [Methylobacterium sp. J-026]
MTSPDLPKAPGLPWLPAPPDDWRERLAGALADPDPAGAWASLTALARTNLDFVQTTRVQAGLSRRFPDGPPAHLTTKPVRLAVLGSATQTHLFAALRVAALRRGIWLALHEPGYGQYLQELEAPGPELRAFGADTVLFALDAHHLTQGARDLADLQEADAAVDRLADRLAGCWTAAQERLGCRVLQQTVLPVFPALFGSNEHRMPGSRHRFVARLNAGLRARADAAGVDLVAVDDAAARHGIGAWHNPVLWHRAKQEVSPTVSPLYGELVARVLAARQGLTAKGLVFDLDNTLWGGVIGDDGLDGIVLGHGDAQGEAFLAVQQFGLDQARRGILLAVCSKNDPANARAPFESHPDMLLRSKDIACFVANWDDKATNLRAIARQLNIGLDSLVFVDDNPFERDLVRTELPMVAVPELPEDPALVPQSLAEAGYFEGVVLTADDRNRATQYRQNAERDAALAGATDLGSYLRGLQMVLDWSRFDATNLPRIVQLINKTNQFNLTTTRYAEDEIRALMADPGAVGLHLRLRDRFGDNGLIAVVIGLRRGTDLVIDTWLMSCRVLKRRVEEATLDVLAAEAGRLGARALVGTYRPTPKNGMVADHYRQLGFMPDGVGEGGATRWRLDLPGPGRPELPLTIVETIR